MKAVLLSIKPKWYELIAIGKKTIEVRKTKPATGTPFKCYMYETQTKDYYAFFHKSTIGKVIGEFVCYEISTYCTEFYPKNRQPIFEAVYQLNEEQSDEQEEIWEAILSNDDECKTRFVEETCLSLEDFRNYLGIGENQFYGWRISDLVIYGEPKELSEFSVLDNEAVQKCEHRQIVGQPEYKTAHNGWIKGSFACGKTDDWCFKCKTKPLTRPPQSWCYVEEREQ